MGRSLALHNDLFAGPSRPAPHPFLAVSAKGFRPFFGLAALYAILIVPIWLTIVGGITQPGAYLDAVTWHAHEMLFGFTVAVIAGFLLTAVGNWTQRETVTGIPLLGVAGVWLVGRIAMAFASSLPRFVPALADLAFLPLLIAVLARPLVAAKNRRNFVMLGIVAALFLANLAVHLEALGVLAPGTAMRGCSVALDVVVLVMLLIAGRVLPMFTRNATGATTIRSSPSLDIASVIGMAALTAADAVALAPRVASAIAGIVGVLAALRAAHWGARHSGREPLLWILHLGYAWLVVGLLMRAGSSFIAAIPSSLATHAMTVGAIGCLTLGMMARVSLGHTGRALAAPKAMRWAFGAIAFAALVRVFAPIVMPSHYLAALVVAGALWSFAFATFLVVYAPILTTPRQDGKPG
jgi:uncharacterized protein involved in response to NO